MKKTIIFFLVIAMVLPMTACISGEVTSTQGTSLQADAQQVPEPTEKSMTTGSGDVTLRLAWYGDGQNKDALDRSLQKYTDQTGIGIETVFIPGSWAEYFTKMQAMVGGGETLDCAYVAIEGFEMFVDMGLAAPIDEWISANQDVYQAVASDVDQNIISMMNFGGKQYGIPMEWNNIVTHINTKLLEQAGLQLPPADWSKEMFLEYCEKLTIERPDGTKQYGVAVPAYYFGFEAWLFSNGGSYMTDDFTKSNLLAPETVEMFQFAQDLVHKYGYAPIGEKGVDDIQQLVDGNIAMGFWGRWPTTKYEASQFKDVAVQYSPKFKQTATVWGGASVFTMAGSKNPDEATKLAIYIASEPFIREFMASGAIPVLNTVAKDVIPALQYPQNNQIFYESASIAKAIHAPIQYPEVETLIARVLSDIITNKADVPSTLAAADAELNAILSANTK